MNIHIDIYSFFSQKIVRDKNILTILTANKRKQRKASIILANIAGRDFASITAADTLHTVE